MIGVIAKDSEKEIVKEFFELFKTPWEFYQTNYPYDVVLSSVENVKKINAKLTIIYGSKKTNFDDENLIETNTGKNKSLLTYAGNYLPIYGDILTFTGKKKPVIKNKETSETAGIEISAQDKKILRIGFDLFSEISFLLSEGQPVEHAYVPTLEMHISMLRDWILNAGIPLIEIPPSPAGYAFIVCLTHDVDFVGIRNHIFDHTLLGFIYRASLGSFVGVLKGRTSWKKLLTNWKAVLLLPFVYLGFAEDFMVQFDRYREIEKGLGSTFFIIPYKDQAGQDISGRTQKMRAVRYEATEIIPELKKLISDGCEMGLHGIEAWRDSEKGREELERISPIAGESDIGVRTHWLYYSTQSPQILDQAGFSYDSTYGYNETVGYRGGTAQAFRPPGTRKLLELPMHIQDTALFYPSHMGLTETKAFDIVKELFGNFTTHGGVLTLNWHHRSIGPERLWGDFYASLLEELKKLNVWFGTAQQVVTWFNKRRSVSFDKVIFTRDKATIKLTGPSDAKGSDLVLRIHSPKIPGGKETAASGHKRIDIPFANGLDAVIPL